MVVAIDQVMLGCGHGGGISFSRKRSRSAGKCSWPPMAPHRWHCGVELAALDRDVAETVRVADLKRRNGQLQLVYVGYAVDVDGSEPLQAGDRPGPRCHARGWADRLARLVVVSQFPRTRRAKAAMVRGLLSSIAIARRRSIASRVAGVAWPARVDRHAPGRWRQVAARQQEHHGQGAAVRHRRPPATRPSARPHPPPALQLPPCRRRPPPGRL